jgi:hypothetical protein
LGELVGFFAEDFLPGGLAFGDFVAAILFQFGAALCQFGFGDQHVAFALIQIDADFVAIFQNRKAAACCGFGACVED